jgi:hypothetical protein
MVRRLAGMLRGSVDARPVSRAAWIFELGFWALGFIVVASAAYIVGPVPGEVSVQGRALVFAWVSAYPFLYLTRVILCLLHGWPVPAGAFRGHVLGSRPLVIALLALVGLLGVFSSTEIVVLVRHPSATWWQVAAGIGAASILVTPFWLWLLYPVRLYRSARSNRIEQVRTTGLYRSLFAAAFTPVRLVREILRARRR